MAKEIKILIPDYKANESIDINVISGGKEVVKYRLEVFLYEEDKEKQSRISFVEEMLLNYNKDYTLVEIGSDSFKQIPVLFRFNKELKESRV